VLRTKALPPIWLCEGGGFSAAVIGVPFVLLHPSTFPIALDWLKSDDFDVGDEAWNDGIGCDWRD
jgi:hypothetical protein